jgi:hypothetical protein
MKEGMKNHSLLHIIKDTYSLIHAPVISAT